MLRLRGRVPSARPRPSPRSRHLSPRRPGPGLWQARLQTRRGEAPVSPRRCTGRRRRRPPRGLSGASVTTGMRTAMRGRRHEGAHAPTPDAALLPKDARPAACLLRRRPRRAPRAARPTTEPQRPARRGRPSTRGLSLAQRSRRFTRPPGLGFPAGGSRRPEVPVYRTYLAVFPASSTPEPSALPTRFGGFISDAQPPSNSISFAPT